MKLVSYLKYLPALAVAVLSFVIASPAFAADLDIDSQVDRDLGMRTCCNQAFVTDPDTIYVFTIDNTNDLGYWKSTDSGATWGTFVEMWAGRVTSAQCKAEWHVDGLTTQMVHCVLSHRDDDAIYYRNIDLTSDTLGTARTVKSTAGVTDTGFNYGLQHHQDRLGISRSGNIYVAGNPDNDNDGFYFRWSDDDGVTWNDQDSNTLQENQSDFFELFAGDETDDDDIYALYFDGSATEVTLKSWDHSAATGWAEHGTAIWTGGTSTLQNTDPSLIQMRDHDNDLHYVMWNNAPDSSTSDTLLSTISGTVGSFTITAKADMYTDTDDISYLATTFDQQNGLIYAAVHEGPNDPVGVDQKIYTISSNTWGSASAYAVDSDSDNRGLFGTGWVGDDGGTVLFAWYEDDTKDLETNSDNATEIAAAAAGDGTVEDQAFWWRWRGR